MHLFISTPLQILHVNTNSRFSETLRSGDGYYFGITCKEDAIVLTHSLGYLQYFLEPTFTIKSIDHLFEPHQIEWVDDKILVANTGRNCLSIFDHVGNWVRDIYFNDIRYDDKDGDRRGNHFNSVHRFGDKIYVLAHNNGRPSELWELTWPELQIIGTKTTNALCAHNFWAGEYGFVICDSKHGSLYELNSGKSIWQGPKENRSFTRGLAVSKEYVFIGYSQHSDRKERYWNNGGIWVVDRKTLKTLDKIPLPGAGQIYDIRLIDTSDECHNGHIFTWEMVSRIRRINPILEFAYRLRQRHPSLQKNLPIISQILRTRQILVGWKRMKKLSSQ